MRQTKKQSPHEAGLDLQQRLGGRTDHKSSLFRFQRSEDEAREHRIDELRLRLLAAKEPFARREAWNALKAEIAARSPAAIAKLERARGLFRDRSCGRGDVDLGKGET